MFGYTKASVKRIVKDFKLLAHVVTLVTQIFMICYLTYVLVSQKGRPVVNAVLLGITAVYLIFYLVTYSRVDKRSKRNKETTRRVYSYTKITLNAFTLVSVMYSIYQASEEITYITLVLTPIMLVMWVLQVITELARIYVERRAPLIIEGFLTDIEGIRRPINRAHNIFRELVGEEQVQMHTMSEKTHRILDPEVEADKRNAEVRNERRKAVFKEKIRNVFRKKKIPNGSTDKPPEKEFSTKG